MEKQSKWTRPKAEQAASTCKTKSEFNNKFSGAEKWARRDGCYEEICSHMRPKFYWDFESVKKEAAKYTSKSDFYLGSSSAAQWAVRNKKMNSLFDDKFTYWDLALVRSEAQKYSSREEFRKFGAGAPQWATRNGYWDDVCAHMELLNEAVTFDEAANAARKHTSRAEFYADSNRSYNAALRNGWLDEICQHMTPGFTASENNVVYFMEIAGHLRVFKVGATSVSLGIERLKRIAGAVKVKLGWRMLRACPEATRVEKQILDIGKPYDIGFDFDGSTEFRQYSKAGLKECLSILGQLPEASQ